ncbi:MAG TPA: hypothetical protein VNN55_10700 [bacterium]|nr:hypothetical protein [bacterium]
MDTIDVDLDGIPELSIPELDRTPPDFEAIRTERYYKLDRSTGVYKAMPVPADSAGKK